MAYITGGTAYFLQRKCKDCRDGLRPAQFGYQDQLVRAAGPCDKCGGMGWIDVPDMRVRERIVDHAVKQAIGDAELCACEVCECARLALDDGDICQDCREDNHYEQE